MNDEQKDDQTSLIRPNNQTLTPQSTNLVRRGLKSLQLKQQRRISADELIKMGRKVTEEELLQLMNNAPKLSPEQRKQIIEGNRRKVENRAKQRNVSMKTGEDGDA